MTADAPARIFKIQNSEKCFRFKPEALENHAPDNLGIYELVHFDFNNEPVVVYIGAAFDKTIKASLEGHLNGSAHPTFDEITEKFPNLHFDYLTQIGGKTKEDAQDVFWWLVNKHKPAFNPPAQNSGRPGEIIVEEVE